MRIASEAGIFFFDPIGLFVDLGTTTTRQLTSGAHSTTAHVANNFMAGVTRIADGEEGWNSVTIRGAG